MLDSNLYEMSDSTSFPLYQPLNPERHEVRLLRILGQTETITCTLETTSFDTSPIYSALSYEWAKYQGEDPGEHVPQIVVNSLPISVTTNLSLALKYLNKDRGLYWIDALCINQEDDEERGHQVRMMARIYQSAERVHAWLGLSDDGSTLGMLLLSDFLKATNGP
jgi:Heterokaryon incompatibility protein (HET)